MAVWGGVRKGWDSRYSPNSVHDYCLDIFKSWCMQMLHMIICNLNKLLKPNFWNNEIINNVQTKKTTCLPVAIIDFVTGWSTRRILKLSAKLTILAKLPIIRAVVLNLCKFIVVIIAYHIFMKYLISKPAFGARFQFFFLLSDDQFRCDIKELCSTK